MIKGFTAGAFDLLHAGHILMLEECKQNCDHLIVALHIDPSTERSSKNKPVESIEERLIRLRACRYVDEIVTYASEAELIDLLKTIGPDVRFIGEDWKGKEYTGRELPIKVIFNSRGHSYSSSELRRRIRREEQK